MTSGFFKQFHRSMAAESSEGEEGGSPETDGMASRKRPRDQGDVNGDVGIETASSSLRHTHQKRSRIALAAERGGSVVSDDDDTVDDNVEVRGLREDAEQGTNTPVQYSENEDEDEEIDDLRATQAVQKQISQHRDNIASEEGVIEEVYCRNFMCHTSLRIALGPLINFIVGHNGSGKSAVLTALTMCLGGKAAATNRGASLKSLIKEGEESATLAVRIKNRGDSAYKPELYGRSITVERSFTRGGTSGFKLKNREGKVISTKKGDLDDILDYFAFQLDNPMNVLTQDMARQFLSNSTATEKYKFFIRGTQLEMLDNDYKILEEHLDNIEAKLHSRKTDMDVLEEKAKEAERKKKRLDKFHAIQEKIDRTRWMHAWAQIEEQERILEHHTQQVTDAEQRVEEKVQAAETSSGAYDGHNQAYEAAERTVVQLKEQLQPTKDERDAAKEVFDANKDEAMGLQTQERSIRDDVKNTRKEVEKLEEQAKTEQQRLADAEGPEHVQRLERLEQVKAAAEEAQRRQMEQGTGIAELQRKRDAAYEASEKAKPEETQAREALNRVKGLLSNLQKDQGQPFEGYWHNMAQLVRAVGQETRWRSKPVGPMGNHVRLLKPEWSSAIERTFGGLLESFTVTNAEDKRLLNQIMGRVGCTTAIYIGVTDPLDTTGKEPDEGIDTILRVLRVDDHSVRNAMIINNFVDQTALAPTHEVALHLITSRARNVRAALCPDKRDPRKATRYEATRSGQEKSSPLDPWNGAPRMKADREEQIRLQRETVNRADQSFQSCQEKARHLQTELNKANQVIKSFEAEQRALRIGVQSAEDAVEAVQNEIESNRPQDGKLQALENQLAESRENLKVVENSFMDCVNQKKKVGDKGKELKAVLDAKQKAQDKAESQLTKAVNRSKELSLARQEALKEKNLFFQEIEAAKGLVRRLQQDRDEQRRLLEEDFIPQATRICPRIPVEEGVTPDVLDKRLEKFSQDIAQMQREAGGTREELTLAYQTAKYTFDDALSQMSSMSNVAKVCLCHRHGRSIVLADHARSPSRTR